MRRALDGDFADGVLRVESVIQFDLDKPAAWRLEVEWSESMISSGKGPLGWRLTRDGTMVAGESEIGTDRAQWPLLCEDVEANVAAGEDAPGWVTRALENCARWAGLWPEDATVPGRDEVRELPLSGTVSIGP